MKNQEIKFKNLTHNYSILIGNNTLGLLPKRVKLLCPNTKKIALIVDKNIPIKFLNASARDIKNKKKVKYFKKYIKNYDTLKIDENLEAAIITPDKDIIPGSSTYTPAYLVYSNYEKILNWNRSLRFALAVCTLKNNFKNVI